MTASDVQAAGLGGEREDMAGLQEVLRPRIGIGEAADGSGSLVRGHAGAGAGGQIDRDVGRGDLMRRGLERAR